MKSIKLIDLGLIEKQGEKDPTLFENYIKFDLKNKYKSIVVYDNAGKEIIRKQKLENNELNTKEFVKGLYYIQVNFVNGSVKTIKVLKQ